MKKIFSIITISLLASFSFSSELTELNAAWLHQNEKTIASQLQTSSDIEVMPIINTLGIIWQNRDGAIGSEVSPYIAQALIFKSNNMLAWFNKHPKALESWLQDIPHSLLTNYNGSQEYSAYLATLKKQLTSSMSSYNGSFKSEAGEVLAAISKAQVHEID